MLKKEKNVRMYQILLAIKMSRKSIPQIAEGFVLIELLFSIGTEEFSHYIKEFIFMYIP